MFRRNNLNYIILKLMVVDKWIWLPIDDWQWKKPLSTPSSPAIQRGLWSCIFAFFDRGPLKVPDKAFFMLNPSSHFVCFKNCGQFCDRLVGFWIVNIPFIGLAWEWNRVRYRVWCWATIGDALRIMSRLKIWGPNPSSHQAIDYLPIVCSVPSFW